MYRARYRRIIWFFGRIFASFLYWDILLPRIGLRKWSTATRSARMHSSASQFRKMAISMGGVMIKVGQFLSTRVDVLPKEVTAELAGLQDEVPPVPFEAVREVIEAEFNQSLKDLYVSFDSEPLAAASLGQVHRAELPGKSQPPESSASGNGHGRKPEPISVVVKVQRPDIENLIKTDLEALRTVGGWLQHFRPIRRRANIPGLLNEFSRILYQEIDYLAEGRNAETFAANFKGNPRVRVPKVYWSSTTVRVLTLENVYAIKITDYELIDKANINRAEVAKLLLNTYLQQIFEDGFFHADPHPGNLFVEPCPVPVAVAVTAGPAGLSGNGKETPAPVRWQLTFVDFGMVGHVPPTLRAGLRELLIGVGTRDSPRVVNAYKQMDILLPGADLVMLERAESHIFDRYWGKSMSELTNLSTRELREFLNEFRDLVFDLPFQVPQDLIFLVRCVSILSGICLGLDPGFNVFQQIAPYTQKLVANEVLKERQDWFGELESLAKSWLFAPLKLDALLMKLERGDITMRDPEVSQQVTRLERAVRGLSAGLVFTALLLGGLLFYLGDTPIGAGILLGGAGLTLLWIIWKNMTSI